MNNEEKILTVLFGWLGYYRFKKGQAGLGLIYLCTCGLFGIGWLIDIYLAFQSVSTNTQSENELKTGNKITLSEKLINEPIIIDENYCKCPKCRNKFLRTDSKKPVCPICKALLYNPEIYSIYWEEQKTFSSKIKMEISFDLISDELYMRGKIYKREGLGYDYGTWTDPEIISLKELVFIDYNILENGKGCICIKIGKEVDNIIIDEKQHEHVKNIVKRLREKYNIN